MLALTLGFTACNQQKPGELDPENPTVNPDKPSVTEQLTPEQSKEKMMDVAKRLTGKFNTDDQKAAIELADGLYEKYRDYDWEAFEEYGSNKYDGLFDMPRYIRNVLAQRQSAAAADPVIFSFENESAVFEADDATRSWKYMGKASDNSLILRFKDKDGNSCEAKFWGEGQTKTYEYTHEYWHWEAPIVYVDDSEIGYLSGEVGDYWRTFYHDEQGWYYEEEYYDDYEGYWRYRKVYVSLSEIDNITAYSYNGYYLTYDESAGRFFYSDWSNEYKVVDGERTFRGVVPEKILFSLKQGTNEIIHEESVQDIEENDHVNFSLLVKVVNLSWTVDLKLGYTSGSVAFDFKYGDERLLGAAANMPSYKLFDRPAELSYEEWAEMYGERYEELIKNIGEASALVDLMGEMQIKAKVDNVGYAYRDFARYEGYNTSDRASVQHFCDLINENQTNGLYFNSSTKQAEVRAQVRAEYDSYDGRQWFYPEGVILFLADSTTYAFEEYFVRKPFTDLQYTVEDLVNKYIHLSQFLYGEVGEVHF